MEEAILFKIRASVRDSITNILCSDEPTPEERMLLVKMQERVNQELKDTMRDYHALVI